MLEKSETFSDDSVLQGIIDSFVEECKSKDIYPWRYYYVKYPKFRQGRYGILRKSNGYEEDDKEKESYMTYVLQTQKSLSSKAYMPFLKAVAKVDEYPRLSDDGQKLILDGDKNIFCENAAYKVINNKDETVIETITISQNEQGIDTEDRIEKLRKYIEKIV